MEKIHEEACLQNMKYFPGFKRNLSEFKVQKHLSNFNFDFKYNQSINNFLKMC